MDAFLVDPRVLEHLLHGNQRVAEVVRAELLEPGTRQRDGVVDTLEEGIDFDGGLGAAGQRALCAFALGAQPTESAADGTGVLAAVLPLEILDAEVDQAVVEVLTTQMCVTNCSKIPSLGRHCNNSLLYILPVRGLGNSLHVHQHHGGDLLWVEDLLRGLVAHLKKGLPCGPSLHDEWLMLHASLHRGVVKLSADETLASNTVFSEFLAT